MGMDENNFDEEESGSGTTPHDATLEPEETDEDKKPDLPSTIARKEQFLKLFPLCRCIVLLTCREMRLAKQTFYRWYREDNTFAKAIEDIRADTNDEVRDLLMKKIKVEEETRAITYYLDRRHPEYKPTTKTEVVTGNKTLEDILKADSENINGDKDVAGGSGDEGGKTGEGSEVPAGEAIQDQK